MSHYTPRDHRIYIIRPYPCTGTRVPDCCYNNMTFSAMGPHLVDFMKVIELPKFLKDHVKTEKRQSPYSPDKLSQLLILQNILGYDRIETSRPLNQDGIMKQKLATKDYPDPERQLQISRNLFPLVFW